MWMRFPEGATNITIERQSFKVEATDASGRGYFRIPDHFAPTVLGLGGFQIADPPEGTDLADLPQADPLRDGAIGTLTRELEATRELMASTNADLNATNAKLHAVESERNKLFDGMARLEQENAALRERLLDFEDATKTQDALDDKKAGKK